MPLLTATAIATPAATAPDWSVMPPAQLRLVVLDATWRKSRKLLHLHPLLQALPRLPLRDPPPSLYRIRKAHAGSVIDVGSNVLCVDATGTA